MTQQEFFEQVLLALDRAGVPYMVTGSVGAMLYGEPRMTNDMDVVIDPDPRQVSVLARAFEGDDFYFPPLDTVFEEIRCRGQFNILHVGSGSKVDLIVRKDTEFARTEFGRRQVVPFSARVDSSSATPEDIILAKLIYYRMGSSQKHIDDIRGILAVSAEVLDLAYLNAWVDRLDLRQVWHMVQPSDASCP
ncbi:MAG: hypothetical protein A3K19_27355 [Lentisphaerae bacterium RIFOXYB12_FULL_65_16]|nr:MAG: hypothetical protein A3K18_15920 [Lentisphaerae bacterium RIFOXYA12_64_32]OGV86408.1 MAG: hypothetical protein A3K19_27355 [Lentisphaerae bacterium RIFOXYB12_FULL_65_16]